MESLEFLEYIPTPTEKHMGVAVIRYGRSFIFRFKISQNPKGEGYFCNPSAMKIGEDYFKAFEFDSEYERRNVNNFVLDHVKNAMAPRQANPYQKHIEQPEQQHEQFKLPF